MQMPSHLHQHSKDFRFLQCSREVGETRANEARARKEDSPGGLGWEANSILDSWASADEFVESKLDDGHVHLNLLDLP